MDMKAGGYIFPRLTAVNLVVRFQALFIGQGSPSAMLLTTRPSGGDTCDRPLADDRPLKFRHCCQNMENHPTTGGFRVDILRHRVEPNLPLLEPSDELDEVPNRPPKTVQPPDHQNVTPAKRSQDSGKAASLAFAAGNPMVFEYPLAPCCPKRILL